MMPVSPMDIGLQGIYCGASPIMNKPLPAKKYGSLPKSFNNMKNAARSVKADRKTR